MLEKGLSKFWEKVSIKELDNGDLAIQLDEKTIKTPAGNQLIIPKNKKILAHMIVQEWTVLPSLKIKNFSLPLTSLSSRAIDTRGNREVQEQIIKDLMPYLDTDTMVVFSPSDEWDGRLRVAQEEMYRPILAEVEQFWGVRLTWMDSDSGVIGNRQTPETKQKVVDWLLGLDEWQLTAVERTTLSAKSIIAATNLIRRQMNISQLAEAVGLETQFQTERWGEVEDTHDVDYADIRRHLGSSLILSYIHKTD
ncbi:ATP12-domain-containing protein [Nadsonia fulvescens var. elongata DSM 6958]|uniref:ATP12-domain-containing protein n=1 Tax=Nadsonia fulvescens var. elongata DSM 6958 TaxID=857566 RepID=A0A1E3PJD8_9ASCO|nr:ATP12-domain-containing protein [Nadsonia fulvescens var. elongata DSM 6958]